jgi:tetratricopeptide (TPR) repeat protein
MYEKKGDIMDALRITEKGLCYDGKDPDLLAKKDSYYYSLQPDDLAKAAKDDDNVRKFFDVGYCVKKAKAVLDARGADLDTLDWVSHLVSLALVMQPNNLIAMVQKGRLHLRRGERDDGLRLLEDVREMKPSGGEESDAWYFTQKQLGKLYLDELSRADLAIPCFTEYLNHVGSGADTHYDLGRAYEAVGDKVNAIRHYNMVTAYEGHPLSWDSQQAIRRLKEGAAV